MKEIQIFQILGLFFFATGVGMLVNPKFIKNILKEKNIKVELAGTDEELREILC